MILWFCHFCIHAILKIRQEQGVFHLLIRELHNYPDHFQVYFNMSVVQFNTLLAILGPHIKNKTNNFCKLIDREQHWQFV